jgi:hypothetical protein
VATGILQAFIFLQLFNVSEEEEGGSTPAFGNARKR